MKKYKREFTFDLNVEKLKEVFGDKSYTKGYDELYTFFCRENNFEHRQGSVYCSKEEMFTHDIYDITEQLKERFPWLRDCLTRMDVADIGELHELTDLIKDDDSRVEEN